MAYLGHIISEKGITTHQSKTCALRERPTTQSCGSSWGWRHTTKAGILLQVRQRLANTAAPLHRLLETGSEWDWSEV
ncbi:hypothetical protein T07_6944 [Trichinella nelsoni]|uniref:Retrovirus-related Pol polyprotein from transposon n=1 Tax=Trichinella nelsoni TaxID=6336 RepID=A0A0V0RSA7_9BILA|nr:hypothetical protein T07_6944 [Trichinella nelsoni]